ncbi:hypothetical protein [Metamycoplasma buccale]|uniref:TMEM164 family acyltransferase n=1 Tax=Metamycoplasma buccale TaxID=55602 RepID=UPI00398E49D7
MPLDFINKSLIENKLFNFFDKNSFANVPPAYGWFHLTWLSIFIVIAIAMIFIFKNPTKTKTKFIYLGFWIILFTIELLKQIYVAGKNFNDYHKHGEAIPLQLCSMPLYIIPIYLLIPNKYEKTNQAFLSYLTIFNLWSGLFVMLYPGDVFTKNIFISNHTMIYHGILFVLGIWSSIRKVVPFNWKTFMWSTIIFIIIYSLIIMGNEIIYQLNKANKTTYFPNLFNMSHRIPSAFVSGIPWLKKLPAWSITLLYIPFTLIGTSLLYTIFWGFSLALVKTESAIRRKIERKKLMKNNELANKEELTTLNNETN